VDSFTFNKIAGSALAALLVIFGIRTITAEIYPTGKLPKGQPEIVVVEVQQRAPVESEAKTAAAKPAPSQPAAVEPRPVTPAEPATPATADAKEAKPATEAPAKTEAQVAAVADGKGLRDLLAAATIEGGQAVARRCVACHSFEKDGRNQVGPALYGVVGREIGGVEGFAYSNSLKAKDGVWDYEALDAFLANPREYAPGNKMAFAGLRRPEERADIILYLRSLSDNPKPLP